MAEGLAAERDPVRPHHRFATQQQHLAPTFINDDPINLARR
jgi:hypothetical protein